MATASCTRDGMDKRKVTCFLLLVVIGIACVCAMLYLLFYASPHANDEIKQGGGRAALHTPSLQLQPYHSSATLTVRS
jgi:hypothetical protein